MDLTEPFTKEAIDQHLSWLTSTGHSANTRRAYRADLRCLLREYGEFQLAKFEDKAADYLNVIREEQAPKTVVRKLGTYRGFGGRIGIEDCLSDYRAPTPSKSIPHPVKGGVESLVKMHDVAMAEDNRDLAGLIALCGFEGLRLHEALSVTRGDLNLEEMTLTVRGKGDKERVIPLFRRAFTLLAPAFVAVDSDDVPLCDYSDRGARYAITRAGRKARVGHVASHDLRSTFATEAYRRSKNLRAVQDMMGHSTSKTTEGYTFVSMDDMRKAGDL